MLAFWIFIVWFAPIMFIQGVIFIMNMMVSDKESKMRETLKIMGLSTNAYALSYIVMQGVLTLFASLIFIVGALYPLMGQNATHGYYIQFIADKIGHLSALYLFIAVFVFGLSLLFLAQIMSTWFSDAKLASQLGPTIMVLPTSISLLILVEAAIPTLPNHDLAISALPYLYFLPWFPFEVVILECIYKDGVTLFLQGMEVKYAWWALCALPIVYYLIYLYLDKVIPNAFGIAQDCFFCLRCGRRRRNERETEVIKSSQLNNSESMCINDGEKEFNQQDPIRIVELTKKFGNFKAVDKLTVSIKGNEVFAILGHNGAGKTTAIYMLTGMLQPSSGEAVLYDNSVATDIDEVRRDLGLCQ